MPSVDQDIPEKGQRALSTHFFKDWEGCYNRSDRSAMPANRLFYSENMIPIGAGNLRSVPNISASLLNYGGTDTIYWSQYVQVASTGYQINFASTGKVFAYNWTTQTSAQINSGNLLSGAGSRCAQFMNLYVLFSDSTGYYYWTGSTFAKLTGTGVPTTGSDIATYAGRVWVSSGRLITYCADYDGTSTTDPTNASAWATANGAGFVNMTDPTLSGNITRLISQNGFLFVAGASCLYSFSNVYVPAGASPPTPVITIYNIQAINGTDQPASMVAYGNDLVFANRWGAYASDGVQAQPFSEDIDGTWQYLGFSPQISAGQCVVSNKLCAAFLFKRLNDPLFGSNTVIGLYFQKKWWFANFGAITFLCTALINSVPTLVAFIGNQMYTLFTNTGSTPNALVMTPLWDMDDPISDKAVIRAGLKAVFYNFIGSISFTVDGLGESALVAAADETTFLQFVNNSGQNVNFVGSGLINWQTLTSYQLISASAPGTWSENVGMTLTTTNANMQLCLMAMDYKKGARWQPQ